MDDATELNPVQEARLALVAEEYPSARVIGWDAEKGGPIIRRTGHPLAYITQTGRLQKYIYEPRSGRVPRGK